MNTTGYIHIVGLSTDTKPTQNIILGSTFYESDTKISYIWQEVSGTEQWTQDIDNTNLQNSESLTYSELETKITNSQLTVGKMYVINDFKTIYEQPITDIISSSTEGISEGLDTIIEHLCCVAISTNKLHYECTSVENPTDLIYYNPTKETLSDSVTTTKGKIERRVDRVHNIDCDYDFRSYKFIRFSILQTVTTNPNTLGGTFKDGNIHKVSLATRVDSSNDVVKLYDETNFKYVLSNNLNFSLCNLQRNTSDHQNLFTFYNPDYPNDPLGNNLFTDIKISGLNNIISSKYETKDIELRNTTNTTLVSNAVNFKLANIEIINTTNSSFVNTSNMKFGGVGTSSNNFINGVKNSAIGNHSSNGVNMVLSSSNTDTSISSCVLRNIDNTTILHEIHDVSLDLLTNSEIYNKFQKIVAFDLSYASIYGECDNVIFNGNVSSLVVWNFGSKLINTVFESDVSNLTINTNGKVVDGCVFDKDITSVIIDSVLIKDTSFLCKIANTTISKLEFDECNVTIGIYENVTEPNSILRITGKNINIFKMNGSNKILVYKNMLTSGIEEIIQIN